MTGSSSTPNIPASLSILVSGKLTRENFHLWRAQVLPAIRAAQLEGFIDGTERVSTKTLEVEKDSKKVLFSNPDYATWCVCDQHVLTYLVTALSREVLVGVAGNFTAAAMWAAISKSFASQSRSRVLHLRNQLVATKKNDLSILTYFTGMRIYADKMATAGKALDDDDIVLYVLNGLCRRCVVRYLE
jgi:hypothetical protein